MAQIFASVIFLLYLCSRKGLTNLCGHIDKKRLTRFVLANSNLVNSIIQNTAARRCS